MTDTPLTSYHADGWGLKTKRGDLTCISCKTRKRAQDMKFPGQTVVPIRISLVELPPRKRAPKAKP